MRMIEATVPNCIEIIGANSAICISVLRQASSNAILRVSKRLCDAI